MYHAWVILRWDLRSLLSSDATKDRRHLLKVSAVVLFYTAFVYGFTYGSFRLFSYVKTSMNFLPGLASAIGANALNATCVVTLITILLTGLQICYKTIYESDDIGFLLAQPVPVRSVFIAKYATGFVSVLALAGSFGLPAWFGYAYANNLDISFYLRSIAGLIALLLVGYSAVSLLLLVAMKKLPGRKMKQLFIISTAILGTLCVLGSQILSSKMARTEDPSMILKQLAQSGLSSTWYLPSTWMTNAVLGSVPEFGVDPGPYWSALIVSAVGLTALAVYSSDLLFLEGWAGRTRKQALLRLRNQERESSSTGGTRFHLSGAPIGPSCIKT